MGFKIFWFTQIKDLKCAISVFNIRILNYQVHIQKKIVDFVLCLPVCPWQEQLGYSWAVVVHIAAHLHLLWPKQPLAYSIFYLSWIEKGDFDAYPSKKVS